MSQPAVKLSKRQKPFAKLVERNKPYPALDAMKLMKQAATAKFDESVDVAVNLGIDAKKSDQTVRGSVVLPAGTGKKVRVAVFAQGDKAAAAKAAGADIVGMEDLAEQIKAARYFDVIIASPDTMRIVGQLGQISAARPHAEPESGHGTDVATAVKTPRPSAIPRRQGGHRAMHDRLGLFHARSAVRKPEIASGGAEQGEAGQQQRDLSAEAVGIEHHGPGHPRGCCERQQLTGCFRMTETASEIGEFEGTFPLNVYRL